MKTRNNEVIIYDKLTERQKQRYNFSRNNKNGSENNPLTRFSFQKRSMICNYDLIWNISETIKINRRKREIIKEIFGGLGKSSYLCIMKGTYLG